ncbi:52 kDa repressor of the inhibitor of the protein kinase-like [Mercenaria mercenaria]|uniref:52 kDa repressor of the inhibitor of the protein kinase-like n=1 Tax=Mercenaria mercenaria TaxID=6596 RepID=UPI00234FADE2|nr:52 kDa repressor of the inhibitor of the protein kinase-like [Mercenaria mercenaria]
MYLPFMDHLLVELDARLLSAEPRFQAQYLIPKQAHLTQEIAEGIFTIYQDDLPGENLYLAEISRWKTRWVGNNEAPSNITQTLNSINMDLYPNVYTILNVFASMPVSTATAER